MPSLEPDFLSPSETLYRMPRDRLNVAQLTGMGPVLDPFHQSQVLGFLTFSAGRDNFSDLNGKQAFTKLQPDSIANIDFVRFAIKSFDYLKYIFSFSPLITKHIILHATTCPC